MCIMEPPTTTERCENREVSNDPTRVHMFASVGIWLVFTTMSKLVVSSKPPLNKLLIQLVKKYKKNFPNK